MSRRSTTVVAALLAVAVVTGCAATTVGSGAPAPPAGTPAPTTSPVPKKEPPQYAPAVSEPKDARGIAACDLITDAQLVELELRPETAEETSIPGSTRSCTWSSAVDVANPAGLELNDDTTIPALDGLHLVRDVFFTYEPLEVAGHPAVRTDYNDFGDCTIATAIADYQGVTTEGNGDGSNTADPCGRSIRMAEAILSNLPPLTEE